MILNTILEHLEQFAPPELAQDWDNVGLLIGEKSRKIKSVLISLDASENAVEYAKSKGHDLILTHHPLIFHPLKSITNPVILNMIESHISLISMHTNFDAAIGGVNHALAEELDLEVDRHLGDPEAKDIGLICISKTPIKINDLAVFTKERLGSKYIKLWTAGLDVNRQVSRIAICGGSGGSALPLAQEYADILITGDVSYHNFLDSKIPIIDAGHFYTEYPALKKLKDSLETFGIKNEIMPIELHEWRQNIIYV